MRHIFLERVAIRGIAIDELARQLHLNLRNFVERVDLGVIHDGHIEAMVYRLFHEDAVKHAPGVGVQPERNIADAQDGFDLRQFLLDLAEGIERLDAGGAVLFLSGRDGQGKRIKDQIARADAVLFRSQFIDAFGNGGFLFGGQRHAFFIDGERDHGSTVALGHRQNFGGALLTIFQIDRVDDGLAGNALERLFDHIGLGGIDKNGCRHTGGDFIENGADIALLVFADDGAAEVKHVRAFIDQAL